MNEKQLKEKQDLHEIIEEFDDEERELGFGILFSMFGILILILLIVMPKVYLKQNIYYKSRDLNSLQYQYTSLIQENIALKQRLQKLKFKNQVLDTLY